MIIILDFISNVLIGLLICCLSLPFLMKSETLTDATLNSFALTFILELDDIVNVFQNDTDYLIDQDVKHAFGKKWNFRRKGK